jgi:hypothetical protein
MLTYSLEKLRVSPSARFSASFLNTGWTQLLEDVEKVPISPEAGVITPMALQVGITDKLDSRVLWHTYTLGFIDANFVNFQHGTKNPE